MALTLFPAGAAQAETIDVTNTNDSGDGSLRAAIEGTNFLFGPDTITVGAAGTIALETPLEPIAEDIEIAGPGAGSLTVTRSDAALPFRIFDFANGVVASLSGLTVSGGIAEIGGGISNGSGSLTLTAVVVSENEAFSDGSAGAAAHGGGIFSTGPLTLREAVVQDNRASTHSEDNDAYAAGGGIFAEKSLNLVRSTISGNLAEAAVVGTGEAGAAGGALRIFGGLEWKIEGSTISGNSAVASGGTVQAARGGAIEGINLTMTGSTVARNSVISPQINEGASLDFNGMVGLSNTIVAEPLGGAESCHGMEGSAGFNLDEDGSCGLEFEGELSEVAAGLDPVLRMNGGPTPTHALLSGSPAIDRGKSFGSVVDQRGLPRPSDFPAISDSEGGDGSDIGAFELQAPIAAPVRVSEVPADTTPPNTRILSGPARLGFKRLAKFRFASTETQSSFQCKLNKKKWAGCRNPAKRTVKPGKHVFKVRAIDRFGNVDPTPARFGWRVKPLGG